MHSNESAARRGQHSACATALGRNRGRPVSWIVNHLHAGLLRPALPVALAALALSAGCKEDDVDVSDKEEIGGNCEPDNLENRGCVDGLSCEATAADPDVFVCAQPIELRGMVIDALSEEAIEGARVFAQDATAAPVTDVVITDAAGNYTLSVPVPRNEDGSPADGVNFTLNASAADYLQYPAGLRPALPVAIEPSELMGGDTDGDTDGDGDGPDVVQNATTTIALIPLEGADAGGVTVSGTVVADEGLAAGTLVVAEAGGVARSGVADLSGNFALFNVPPGSVTVSGYRGGISITPASVEVADEDVDDVQLEVVDGEVVTVSGSVSIVNAPGGSQTSVVLVPSVLFNENLERGPVPFGLRAPEPGFAVDVNGAWSIAGVPPGTYRVLAAFENDDLVRDPDMSIAGTDIPEITVTAGQDVDVGESFKITEALAVTGPGAEGPELVTGTPTFIFADDSSEDGFTVVVYDALGNEVWRDDAIPGVSGSATVEVPYGGPALTEGIFYQFRATSYRDKQGGRTNISRTEDLRGVFEYGGG